MQRPIAVLDSGVGGLTVVKELMRQLPDENIVYYGDTLRAPYGSRAANEVLQYTEEVVQYLLEFHPKLIVIACNTATAVALEHIQAALSIPVTGVIDSGARAALRATKTKYIGVIGTEGTIQSKAYNQALLKLDSELQIVSKACPAFVPLVEKGHYQSPEAYHVVYEAIAHMRAFPIDCLILGCTHYPFLSNVIASVMGQYVRLIHSAEETTSEVKQILLLPVNDSASNEQQKEVSISFKAKRKHIFICSGDVESFKKIAQQWLSEELNGVMAIYMSNKAKEK